MWWEVCGDAIGRCVSHCILAAQGLEHPDFSLAVFPKKVTTLVMRMMMRVRIVMVMMVVRMRRMMMMMMG